MYDNKNSTTNWREQTLYGSSRLGTWLPNTRIGQDSSITQWDTVGYKQYELNNHLGNVMVTVTDKRLQHSTDSKVVDFYQADVATAQEYYSFGALMPARTYPTTGKVYRYGFNGKENDNEVNGVGNEQDYGARIYDDRLARFMSTDPITKSYPDLTSYQFASNRPVDGVDIDGKEWAQNVKVSMNKTTLQIETDFTEKVKVINQSTIVTDPNVIKAKAELYKAANENKFKGDYTYYLGPIVINLKYKTDVVLDFTPPSPSDGNQGELIFDDRKSVKSSSTNISVTTGIIGTTTTTTTVTREAYTGGETSGQINDFKIHLGITKDGNFIADGVLGQTAQHETGHSAGLNHPFHLSMFEKTLMPELNQGGPFAKGQLIKDNLMNSAENPDLTLRNDNGSDITPGQLNVMSQKIKRSGNFTTEDLKPATPPKSN